ERAESSWDGEMERQAAIMAAAVEAWEMERRRIAEEEAAADDFWEMERERLAEQMDMDPADVDPVSREWDDPDLGDDEPESDEDPHSDLWRAITSGDDEALMRWKIENFEPPDFM
ncbi:MAG TPA: hypothetical protein PL039_06065, partial [Kiritimatiellia bacterium]|nr:hypothetical protein [Kiritimatiellia bacterium]